jgi:D-aminopeptidase
MPNLSTDKKRITVGGLPTGPLNAITDVEGVRVGHSTVIHDKPNVARSGVTMVYPTPAQYWEENVFAGFHRYNGYGEVSGTHWLAESGILTSPVCLTATFSLGLARDTMLRHTLDAGLKRRFQIPVVGETNDFFLNEAITWPIKPEHVIEAMDSATGGVVAEGNVGAGTGTVGYLFKGGIGTASKVVETPVGKFTVGVLIQSNHGRREDLMVDGVPVGLALTAEKVPFPRLNEHDPYLTLPPFMRKTDDDKPDYKEDGSIQIIVATDAPLLPVQCQRLAQRASIGLGRAGGFGNNGSGDFSICFSTGNRFAAIPEPDQLIDGIKMFPNDQITPLFKATVEATEAAIINSLLMAETMEGRHGNKAWALPHSLLTQVMQRYGRSPQYTNNGD